MKFITFEGGEGAGKTTVIKELEARLVARGKKVVVTREPGGVDIAEQIRNVILDNKNANMDPKTEAALFAASRREHIVTKLERFEGYDYILCDRYIDSSLAYQGHARGLGIEWVYNLNKMLIGDYMPDKTYLIDVTPEVGIARIHSNTNRADTKNRLDNETMDFHNLVYEGYQNVANMYPERITKINGEREVEVIVEDILNNLGE